ncbi:MAG TPA: class I SAM-dependent methyltransferase [Candidatus Dormibacteraeota bacterium]|nr:class I SAM-dependent methyltransferase [Candidatus Dormibacteraeota bacterium]
MTPENPTDRYWTERATTVSEDHEVNLMDVFQRELEFDEICADLRPDMNVLEVGCGNGYSTARLRSLVTHVDAFDKSPAMIERARRSFGEKNNRFIEDDVLSPRVVQDEYDCVVCVRVLINLPDTAAQKLALENMTRMVRSGGLLLLAEGFREGFEELSDLRAKVGMPPVVPAAINHYSSWHDVEGFITSTFDIQRTWHLGMYDYLTRVVYPLVVGATNAKHNTNFSAACHQLARAFNPDAMTPLSRVKGFVLKKR